MDTELNYLKEVIDQQHWNNLKSIKERESKCIDKMDSKKSMIKVARSSAKNFVNKLSNKNLKKIENNANSKFNKNVINNNIYNNNNAIKANISTSKEANNINKPKNNIFGFASVAQEKKIKNLVATKTQLFKNLNNKRKHINLENNIKSYCKKILNKNQNNNEKNVNNIKSNIFDKLQTKKCKLQKENRNKKVRDKVLKVKKMKKQLKMKNKEKNYFLDYNEFGAYDHSKYCKHIDTSDWRLFIEKQMKSIIDSKLIDVDRLSKNLIYEIELIESNRKQDDILKNIDDIHSININSNEYDIKENAIHNKNISKKVLSHVSPKFIENEITQQKKKKIKKEHLNNIKKELEDLKKENITSHSNKAKLNNDINNLITSKYNNFNTDKLNNQKDMLTKIDEENTSQLSDNNNNNNNNNINNNREYNSSLIFNNMLLKNNEYIEHNQHHKILNINQRMLAFKTKLYNKIDLSKIIQFWVDNRSYLNLKVLEIKKLNSQKAVNNNKIKDKDEKKTDKNETNVKYEFKKPDNDLLKIIPFCNNIFSIQKSDN